MARMPSFQCALMLLFVLKVFLCLSIAKPTCEMDFCKRYCYRGLTTTATYTEMREKIFFGLLVDTDTSSRSSSLSTSNPAPDVVCNGVVTSSANIGTEGDCCGSKATVTEVDSVTVGEVVYIAFTDGTWKQRVHEVSCVEENDNCDQRNGNCVTLYQNTSLLVEDKKSSYLIFIDVPVRHGCQCI